MKKFYTLLTSLVIAGIMFSGCEAVDEPLDAEDAQIQTPPAEIPTNKLVEPSLPEYFVTQLANFEVKTLNGYEVKFSGREVKGTGESMTTTFNYLVTGKNVTPALDNFSLEVPLCAGVLQSFTPIQATSIETGSILWNSSIPANGSQSYSITFKGNIPLGVINSTIVRGGNSQTTEILGPCKGVYTLSGSLYIDANESKTKQTSESGISSVTINLKNTLNNNVVSVNTSANGSYSFMALRGNYSITVSPNVLDSENYQTSGATFYNLTNLSSNTTDLNFGYLVNSVKMIQNFENKVLLLNTKPTKYWVQEIRNAGRKNSVYTLEQIREILTKIEGMLLAEPFRFGAQKEVGALEILTRPLKSELDFFLQQLLTAELNIATDKGVVKDLTTMELNNDFNMTLLIYSEAIACRELGKCSDIGEIKISQDTNKLRSSDTQLLLSFNGSGGI